MLNSKARKRKRHVDDSCPAGTERETDDEGSGKRPTICTCLFLATVSPLPGRERPLSKVILLNNRGQAERKKQLYTIHSYLMESLFFYSCVVSCPRSYGLICLQIPVYNLELCVPYSLRVCREFIWHAVSLTFGPYPYCATRDFNTQSQKKTEKDMID